MHHTLPKSHIQFPCRSSQNRRAEEGQEKEAIFPDNPISHALLIYTTKEVIGPEQNKTKRRARISQGKKKKKRKREAINFYSGGKRLFFKITRRRFFAIGAVVLNEAVVGGELSIDVLDGE